MEIRLMKEGYLNVTLEKEEPAELLSLLEQYFEKYSREGTYRTTLTPVMDALQERTDLNTPVTFRIYQQEALVFWEIFGPILPRSEMQGRLMSELLSVINECREKLAVRMSS